MTRGGAWGDVTSVSQAPVWVSRNAGVSIDQGPALVIGADGVRHLTYIQDYDAGNDYGRVHYVGGTSRGWSDQALDVYTHDPGVAVDGEGRLFVVGHGHPRNAACRSLLEMCVTARSADGAWGAPRSFAVPARADSFDASPSVRWSAVGFNRPEAVELLFFSAVGGAYSATTLYYGRLAVP
jgi:hypothetical protein